MKKITYLLVLFPILLTAQIQVNNNWKNLINPTFQNLDKSKIQSGMLLDYAMEFTDVTAYNGVLTDTTYIDANILGDIYKTLFMSKVVADTVHTPLFDRYAYNWSKARFMATKDSSSVHILSGLLYEYQKFNVNALAQNKITITSNKYYDKYINGVWQNPYETKKTFALTTPIQHSRSKNVYFKLPSNLFLSNVDSQIASIQINADNGLGYQNFPFDTVLQLQFFENKIHNIIYKITLTNNQVLYCRSKLKVDDPSLDGGLQRGSIVVNDERVYIFEDGNFFNAAWLTIRRIPGNNQITRPFIIAEGLDTGNFTAPEDFGGERTMDDFLDDLVQGGAALGTLIDANNFNHEYDLIYIDWVRGMADMRDNSRVLEEVIEWINAQKVISDNPEPNVLLGQSMGGVIGRYTLARMEQEDKPHDVRLFIAHDSPMQGANTPLAFQHFSIHMKQEYTSTPLIWGIGEVLIPIGIGLGELGNNFLNAFGTNTSVQPFVTPSQLLSLQDQTASRQLNYWSAVGGPFGSQSQTRSFNQSWQQTLTDMGWPQLSRNVAISNGNECSVDNGFAPGAPLLVIDSRSNPGFWLDILNVVLAPLTGVATQDIGLVLVGALPGRSRWQTNFDFNSYGVQGSQNLIYRGRIRFEKKLLWIGPTIIHNLLNKSYNAPPEALPFDTYSGGRFNFFDEDGDFTLDIPVLSDLVSVVNEFYGFIPVVSSLDIKRNNGQVNPVDYLKKYAGGSTPEPALTSGFNNFIVDYNGGNPINSEHISFQARNGNWLAEELDINPIAPIYPIADCTNFCASTAITGPATVCSTTTFSVPADATAATWSISEGNALVSFTLAGTSIIVTPINTTVKGFVTLNAVYSNERCGISPLVPIRFWVGKPLLNGNTISGPNVNVAVNYGHHVSVPAATGTTTYEWSVTPDGNNCGSSGGIYPPGTVLPKFTISGSGLLTTTTANSVHLNWGNCVGYYNLNCKASNVCGFSYYSTKRVQVYNPNGGGVPDPCPEATALDVYPNPVESEGEMTVNIPSPIDPCNEFPELPRLAAPKNDVTIYDFYGNLLFSQSYAADTMEVAIPRLKKGHYVLNVFTSQGKSRREVIIVK